MHRSSLRLLLGCFYYLFGSYMTQVFAQTISPPHSVTLTLPNSYYVDWQLKEQKLPLRIFVSVPEAVAPQDGFPVVYLLDGNAFFSTGVMASKSLTHERSGGKQPAIIVGVGYPIDGLYDVQRRWYDLTPPTVQPPKAPQQHMDKFSDIQYGGAALLQSFLIDQLRPWLAKQYPINNDKQVLFGHSLGGLFALYTLNTRPNAFSAYGVASPSLWWNDGYLKKSLEKQSPDDRDGKAVIMVVGGEEKAFMLSDAKLAQNWFLQQGVESELRILPFMNHGFVSLPALTMALETLLPEARK